MLYAGYQIEKAEFPRENHCCFFYESEEERRPMILNFGRQCLERGEKVTFISGSTGEPNIINYLQEEGVEVNNHLSHKQVDSLYFECPFFKHGIINSDRMLNLLLAETEKALNEGFTALVVFLEMASVVPLIPASDYLIELESKIEEFCLDSNCRVYCLYQRRSFSPRMLWDVLTLHPVTIIGTQQYNNAYYIPSTEFWYHDFQEKKLNYYLNKLTETRPEQKLSRDVRGKYRQLVENLPDIIFTVDLEGHFTYLNHQAEIITGYTRDQLKEMSGCELISPESNTIMLRQLALMSAGKGSEPQVVMINHASGRKIALELSLMIYRDESQEKAFIQGRARDISQQQAIDSLRLELDRLMAVMDRSPVATFMIDRKQQIILWNRASELLTEITRQSVLGKPLRDISFFQDKAEPILAELMLDLSNEAILRKYGDKGIHEASPDKNALEFVERIRLKGEERVFNILSTRFADENGEIIGVIQCAQDITEREQLQKQLQHAQKMQAVGTLASGMAHEFNNILNIIQASAQAISLESFPGQTNDGLINDIESACSRAGDLIQKIMTFSRLDSDDKLPIKLNRAVEKIVQMTRRTFPPQIAVEAELETNLPFVKATQSQIEQVLLNLVVNARDANSQGGKIKIQTRLAIPDKALLIAHPWLKEGSYVEIIVRDEGEGMAPVVMERIFEPFYTTKEVGKGTGLGLSIAYSIIKNHGGYIWAESQSGRGSAFHLFLPSLKDEAPGKMTRLTKISAKKPLPRGGGELVMLVDDEPQLRKIVGRLLSANGYQVLLASNGKEAFQLYQHRLAQGTPPDVVILDLNMPVIDGQTCLKMLMELDSQARVLIATGCIDPKVHQSLIELKVMGIIQKPYKLDKLLGSLAQALDYNPKMASVG